MLTRLHMLRDVDALHLAWAGAVRRKGVLWGLTRAGCLVSMCCNVAYGGLMVAIGVGPVFGYEMVEGWGIFLTWCAASVIIGFLATWWGTWRWLKR